MSKINHARLQHHGKRIEISYPNSARKPFIPAKPAGPAKVLSLAEKAKVAAQYGYKVA